MHVARSRSAQPWRNKAAYVYVLPEVSMLVRAPGVSLTLNVFVECKMFNLIHSGSACELPVKNDMVRVCECFPKCINQERLSYNQAGLLALCLEPSSSVESLRCVRVKIFYQQITVKTCPEEQEVPREHSFNTKDHSMYCFLLPCLLLSAINHDVRVKYCFSVKDVV